MTIFPYMPVKVEKLLQTNNIFILANTNNLNREVLGREMVYREKEMRTANNLVFGKIIARLMLMS